MSRWIDADAWWKAVQKHYTDGDCADDDRYELGINVGITKSRNVMMNAPSIDIVPRKAVKGYEGYYEVDMYGRVYSLERTITVNDNGRVYEKPIKECELSQSTHSAGYKTVGLTRNGKTENVYVHRLVAEAYIPNPQNLPFINHKDEDKANNFVTNLEWCTVQYNNTYGDKTERQANAIRGRKHTQEHIEKIRRSNIGRHGKQKEVVCVDDGKHFPSYADASLYYGISPKTVKSCCERKSQGRKKTFRYADDFCSYGERSEKPNNCEHITEDGVTCAKYPACDDCPDNPLNKVKGSERLVKGKTEQTEREGE